MEHAHAVHALLERYERHGLDEVLFALTVGGLRQRKVVGWVRRFLGGPLRPRRSLRVAQRRSEAIPARRYRALVVGNLFALSAQRFTEIPERRAVGGGGGARRRGFDVWAWRGAEAESTAEYEELLTQPWRRGLQAVELIVSDGLLAVRSAAQTVYPAARHQLCLAHGFRHLQALTPRFA